MRKLPVFVLLIACLLVSIPYQTCGDEPVRLVVLGKQITPDVPPQIINGRTMVPLRFVAEALGMDVYWSQIANTVVVSKRPPAEPTITGTDVFKRQTREALDILRQTDRATYHLVCEAFTEITEAPHERATAWTTGQTCFFNISPPERIYPNKRAVILAHEAMHSTLMTKELAHLYDTILTREDGEIIADLLSYRLALRLLDNETRDEVRTRLSYNLTEATR